MSRLQLAEEARLLRPGRRLKDVAAELGISTSYASELLLDPDGSKARKRAEKLYPQTCSRCGGPRIVKSPREIDSVCRPCANALLTRAAEHAFEEAVFEIRRLGSILGRTPGVHEWRSLAAPGLYGPTQSAAKFGRALVAAGLAARPVGEKTRDLPRDLNVLAGHWDAPPCSPAVTARRDRMLGLMQARPWHTSNSLAAALGVSQPTAVGDVAWLGARGVIPDPRDAGWLTVREATELAGVSTFAVSTTLRRRQPETFACEPHGITFVREQAVRSRWPAAPLAA